LKESKSRCEHKGWPQVVHLIVAKDIACQQDRAYHEKDPSWYETIGTSAENAEFKEKTKKNQENRPKIIRTESRQQNDSKDGENDSEKKTDPLHVRHEFTLQIDR
jgi:hypothetical protein